MNNEYQFLTHWRVPGTAEEVYSLISHPEDFPRWWPSVYLKVEQIEPGDDRGLGRRVRLRTKGWLPYTLLWESRSTEMLQPTRLVLQASGDFNGRGIWTFQQDAGWVDASFDWQLTADKPLLRGLSFLLKPLFTANHRWAMVRGEESLRLELARRHAASPHALELIPPPPAPNRSSGWWLALGTLFVVAVIVYGALKI